METPICLKSTESSSPYISHNERGEPNKLTSPFYCKLENNKLVVIQWNNNELFQRYKVFLQNSAKSRLLASIAKARLGGVSCWTAYLETKQ